MTDVFINYRGADSNYAARLLFEGLKPRFGRQVFFDEETIQPGEDYVLRLLGGVRESTVLLAVIGPQWLASDASGQRRIDDPRDWIRRELVTAYACGVRVIPVFTEGARPEDLDGLPADIAALRTSQGMNLRLRHADEDIAKISGEVARHVPARRRRGVAIAAVLTALLLVGSGVGLSFLFRGDREAPAASGSTTTGPTTTSSASSSVIEPTTTRSTASTTKPSEPEVLWAGELTLDADTFTTGWSLDSAPPAQWPLGDLGLCGGPACGGAAVGGVAFAPWDWDGLPERKQCVDLLNSVRGVRQLPVKVGTKACLATEGRRVGHLEVVEIGGPGKMKINVKVWNAR